MIELKTAGLWPAVLIKGESGMETVEETMDEVLETVGNTVGIENLSLNLLIRVTVTALVGILLIRLLTGMMDRMLERSRSMHSIKKVVHTAVSAVLWILLALTLAGALDVDVTSIIAVLSVAGLAVSLALQNTMSNLAGGLVLLATKPFTIGDYVEVDGLSGTISAVSMAYTTLVTPENKQVFIPNSQMAATKIVNYSALGKRRMDLKLTASYNAPTARVRAAIEEAISVIPGVLDDPAPVVYVSEYQASSIEYLARLWTGYDDYWTVYYALIEGVRESFDRFDVEMTYDHLNVHIVER